MAVRSFNGSSDHIDCAIGSYNPTGASTLAVLIKRGANGAWHTPIAINNSSGLTQVGLDLRGDNDRVASCGAGGTVDNASITELVADGWCIAVVTMPSPAFLPRIHLFKFGGAWQHGVASSTVSGPGSMSGGKIVFGRFDTASDYFNGKIAVAGVWNSALSDADVEALSANLRTSDWTGHSTTPVEVWQFNQASTGTAVTGLVGAGTHDQSAISGTSVVTGDDPSGWTFSGGGTDATVTAVPFAVTTAVPAPAVTGSGGATVSAAPFAVTAAVPAPTVQAGARVTAAPLAVTAAMVAPAGFSSEVTAAPFAVTAAIPAPAVGNSADATVNAVPFAVTAAIPAPAPAASSTVTAAPAAVTAAVPAPAQRSTTNAAPCVLTVAMVAPSISPAPPAPTRTTALPLSGIGS